MPILTPETDGTVTLALVQGDSVDLVLTVKDESAVLVNLTEATDGTPGFPAIVRMAIKDSPSSESNASALAYRTSFRASQVEILLQGGSTLGQVTVHLDKPDTEFADPTTEYQWDVEVSRQGASRTSAGTASVGAGGAVTGAGTAFLNARAGDIMQFSSGANLGKAALVLAIADDSHLSLENPTLAVDTGATFTIRRGVHRTVVRGACVFTQGVVTQ